MPWSEEEFIDKEFVIKLEMEELLQEILKVNNNKLKCLYDKIYKKHISYLKDKHDQYLDNYYEGKEEYD